ncbi:hypothetical protein ACFZCY_09040 [Streptomyces sp. NPDC007983]|uniref:hypothetical protein n=1 Tax=Streptomyces sp. NPDC007983 TaxID=3364800 RepID=UPI0036EBD48B
MSVLLYARSRTLPLTAASLVTAAAATAWCADWLMAQPAFGAGARLPVVVLAPLFASAAIGASLYTHSEELDRTAVRPWWPRRLCHLLLLTALAAALLAAGVRGRPEQFGAPAMVRNTVAATGVTALAAALIGARLSWLPVLAHTSAVYLTAGRDPGGRRAVWAWSVQPGPERAAWWTAGVMFAMGTVVYAVRGARPEGPAPRR